MKKTITERIQYLLKQAKTILFDDLKEKVKTLSKEDESVFWNEYKKSFFVPENMSSTEYNHESPSDKYKLSIVKFKTKKGFWDYSQGSVYKGDELITIVQRNYGSFWFAWIENHANGHDYLLCGEDYQGQTIIELDTGKRIDYLPKGADAGFGFCWVEVFPSPNGNTIAVDGCFWACPYEVILHDFSEPMNPPWPELDRMDSINANVIWTSNTECKVNKSMECFKIDENIKNEHPEIYEKYKHLQDKLIDKMTDEELVQCDNFDLEPETNSDTSTYYKDFLDCKWVVPTKLEATTKYIKQTLRHRKDKDMLPTKDVKTMISRMLSWLDEEDYKKIITDKTISELLEWNDKSPSYEDMRK